MDRKDMHGILKEAIRCARAGDERSVLDLNDIYYGISKKVYSDPLSELDLLYDKCMTSCLMAVGHMRGFESLKGEFLAEAQSIYRRLDVPGD